MGGERERTAKGGVRAKVVLSFLSEGEEERTCLLSSYHMLQFMYVISSKRKEKNNILYNLFCFLSKFYNHYTKHPSATPSSKHSEPHGSTCLPPPTLLSSPLPFLCAP